MSNSRQIWGMTRLGQYDQHCFIEIHSPFSTSHMNHMVPRLCGCLVLRIVAKGGKSREAGQAEKLDAFGFSRFGHHVFVAVPNMNAIPSW